jgi:hypothetical protein
VPPEERASRPGPPTREGADVGRRAPVRGDSPAPSRDRGLSAPALALASLALATGAGTLDALTSGELGRWFAVGFVVASVGGTVAIRRSDLLWALIWPPLVFATAVVLTAPAVPGGSGGDVRRQLLELATTLSLEAPLLLGTTAAVAVVALARRLGAGDLLRRRLG